MSRAGVAGFNICWRLQTIARLDLPRLVLPLLEFVLYADASMMNLL